MLGRLCMYARARDFFFIGPGNFRMCVCVGKGERARINANVREGKRERGLFVTVRGELYCGGVEAQKIEEE